jgi:catechol 2,3-dioxygenase-like lactoylglutathione lyase family enzyme
VRNAAAAVAFYRDRLGFDITYQEPELDANGYALFFGRPRENLN